MWICGVIPRKFSRELNINAKLKQKFRALDVFGGHLKVEHPTYIVITFKYNPSSRNVSEVNGFPQAYA